MLELEPMPTLLAEVNSSPCNIGVVLKEVANRTTQEYIKHCEDIGEVIDFIEMGQAVLQQSQLTAIQHNEYLPRGQKSLSWNVPKSLPPYSVAETMASALSMKSICLMNFAGEDQVSYIEAKFCPLGVYIDDENDPRYGTYSIEEEYFDKVALSIEPTLSKKGLSEVKMIAKAFSPVVCMTRDPHLIPVKNGIFDDAAHELLDFSPDYVFLNKSPIRYNPNAKNVVIDDDRCDGGTWDVETWMANLNDNPEVVRLLWDVLAAAMRPNRQWDKAAFLYATRGCNGKGTFCSLLTNLVGQGSVCSMNLEQMNNPSYLEGIVGASVIYGDENDVGHYIDGSANFKSLVTGDTVAVNRKYEKVARVGFSGLIIQNCNEKPRVRDRTDSLCRRIILIPFDKSFAGETENKDIKHDYLRRPEVLEYVMYKVLNREIEELVGCDATDALMDEFRLENSSVRQWADEFMDRFVWDLIPTSFAYDLYTAWNARVNASKNTTTLSRLNFKRELMELIETEMEGWEFKLDTVNFNTNKARKKTCKPEPLIAEYNLLTWRNPQAATPDTMNCPAFAKTYRDVIIRKAE